MVGCEDGILNMGTFCLHHSVCSDYLHHFIGGNGYYFNFSVISYFVFEFDCYYFSPLLFLKYIFLTTILLW